LNLLVNDDVLGEVSGLAVEALEESKAVIVSLTASDSEVALSLISAVPDLVDVDLGVWVNADRHVLGLVNRDVNERCILSVTSLVADQLAVAITVCIAVSLSDSARVALSTGVVTSDH
jgi:hypothetical protein